MKRTRSCAASLTELDQLGIVLGAFEEISLEEQRLDLASDDALILYTDGVTEALNGEGEMFGEERLQAVMAASRGASADETIGAICGALAAFTGGADPADDVTVVVARRESCG